MMDLGTRLGPRARAALARSIETAVQAGRKGQAPSVQRHVEHALDTVETGMILDVAEAKAAALSADVQRDAE
jgi:hypothetical protein